MDMPIKVFGTEFFLQLSPQELGTCLICKHCSQYIAVHSHYLTYSPVFALELSAPFRSLPTTFSLESLFLLYLHNYCRNDGQNLCG